MCPGGGQARRSPLTSGCQGDVVASARPPLRSTNLERRTLWAFDASGGRRREPGSAIRTTCRRASGPRAPLAIAQDPDDLQADPPAKLQSEQNESSPHSRAGPLQRTLSQRYQRQRSCQAHHRKTLRERDVRSFDDEKTLPTATPCPGAPVFLCSAGSMVKRPNGGSSAAGTRARRLRHGLPARGGPGKPRPPSRKRTWPRTPFRNPVRRRTKPPYEERLCWSFSKWRDPDLNRGHHDFQNYGASRSAIKNYLQTGRFCSAIQADCSY
jgi:hypothetical protein